MIKNRRIFLTLTSSPKGTILYVDGVRAEKFPGFPLFDDLPAGQSVLVIGNSATGKSWWEGDLLGLALYNRVLSELEVRENYSRWVKQDYQSLSSEPGMIGLYPFKEGKGEWVRNGVAEVHSLYLPSVFHPLQKIVLEWPAKTDLKRRGFYQDMAVNILGFIPLGFLLTFWLLRFTRLRAAGAGRLTLLIGALTSLAIELAQVYLPSRSSSAGDLVFNTLGTLIGIVLLRPAMRYKKTGATVS
jgi:VanZ family protein